MEQSYRRELTKRLHLYNLYNESVYQNDRRCWLRGNLYKKIECDYECILDFRYSLYNGISIYHGNKQTLLRTACKLILFVDDGISRNKTYFILIQLYLRSSTFSACTSYPRMLTHTTTFTVLASSSLSFMNAYLYDDYITI